ncbi:unnamed protein product [Lampetra planeri]
MLPITNGGLGRTRPPLARRQNTIMSLREILWGLTHHIGEPSLWAVLRECVMALKNREQRPVYVSLDTVTIVPSGIVRFMPVSPQDDLDEFFLAPELEKQGIISEKSCIFGVAQTVLAAATLCLPSSQGPQLTEHFQQLLARMTEPDAEKRLSISTVLKDCNEYQSQTGILTQEICMMLRMEAMHGQILQMQEQCSGQQGARTKPKSPPPCPARASRPAPACFSHSTNDHSGNPGRSGFVPVSSTGKFEAVRGPVPTKTPPQHAGGANHNPERSMSVDDGAQQMPRRRVLRQQTWTETGHRRVSRQSGVDADHTTARLPSDTTADTAAAGQPQPSRRQSENHNPCPPAASPAPQQCFSLVLDESSGNYLLVPVSSPQDPAGATAPAPGPIVSSSPLVMMSAAGSYAPAAQYGARAAALARGNWPNSNGDGRGPDHPASPDCGSPLSPGRATNWSSQSGPLRQPATPVARPRGRPEQWTTSTPVQGRGAAAAGRTAVGGRARGNGSFGGRACSLSPDLEFRRAEMWAAQAQGHPGSYEGSGTQGSGYSPEAQWGSRAPVPAAGRRRTPSSPEVGPSSPGHQGQNGRTGAAEGPHSPRPISPQQQRILRLLREEFAFEGYMENGAVEMEMAEFIRALRVLNFKAFSYLVKERYPDLYWDDGLLRKLHSRDTMPPLKIQSRPSFQKPPPGVERRIDCTGPEPVTSNAGRGNRGAADMEPGLRSSRSRTWSESTFRQHGTPRSAGKSASPGSGDSRGSGSKVAGRVQCTGECVRPDPAVTCGNISEVPAPERSPDDQAGIQVWKSVCQKDTGIGEGSGNPAALPALRRPISCQSANSSLSELYSRESWEGNEGDGALGPNVTLGWPGGETRGGSAGGGGGGGSRMTNNNSSSGGSIGGGGGGGGDGGSGSCSGDGASSGGPSSDFPCPSGPQPTCLGWALAFRGEADFNEEIKTYAQTLGRKYGQSAGLEERLQELEQQLMLEKKNLKKTQTYYRKLTQGSVKSKSGGDRGLLFKLTSQMEETQGKVELMHFVRSYLELLTAEQCGLNLYDLPSLKTSRFAGQPSPDSVTTDMGEEEEAEDAMAGDVKDVAPPTFGLLFQAAAPKEGAPKESTAFVHAGTPLGLMSYLYAKNSLSQGYIHQFFYTYRYFVSPQQLLSFIMEQFVNASSVYTPHSSKICQRSMDLLHMWLQTCYRVDFAGDAELTSVLQGFILNKVVSYHETAGQHLLHHSSNCDHSRGQGSLSSLEEEDDYAVFSPGPASARASLDIGAARVSRTRDQHKARLPVQQQMSVSGCLGLFRQMSSVGERDTSVYKHSAKSPGAYMLANYTATQIALQLTLLEEATFKSCLPVHFMNTRAQGVRENLQPGINRLTICSPEGVSLFVPDCKPRGSLWKFLDHSANISTWVSAEILSCDSIKTQLAVLSKFLHVAKTCSSLRNFASSMQILSGLENFTVRQLPVWRSLPSKAMAIMEELVAVKVFLKSDSECLLEADTSRPKPTIPCPHLFSMHVQQLEVGGFTMANRMYKWPKLRSLARTVHQIAAFQSRTYALAPDEELKVQLRARICRFRGADLQALASQHEPNYHRQPAERNSRKVHEVLAKVRATFQ